MSGALLREVLVLVALLGLLFLGGCTEGFRSEELLRESFDLPADATHLTVRVPSGAVTVSPGQTGKVELEAAARRWAADEQTFAKLQEHDFAPRLVPGDGAGHYRFEFRDLAEPVPESDGVLFAKVILEVPPTVALDIVTARGPLAVTGWRAPVTLRTGSGNLLLKDIHGPVDAETGLGELVVSGHRGDLRVRSGGGTLFVDLDEFGPGGLDLATEEPSMVLRLPPATGFELDARVLRSTTGKVGVRTGYGVETEEIAGPAAAGGRTAKGHRARGSVLGGGPPVRLEVGQGYLSVVPRRSSD